MPTTTRPMTAAEADRILEQIRQAIEQLDRIDARLDALEAEKAQR